MHSVGTASAWVIFAVLVVVALAFDLLYVHRRPHAVSFREALGWSVFWVALGLLFGLGIGLWISPSAGVEYYAAYLIEKSLSVDNLFVFVALFRYFGTPPAHQHRVLFWGVLGAIVLRGIFIGAGAALVQRFDWMLYVFGVVLLWGAVRMARQSDETFDPETSRVARLFGRLFPLAPVTPDDPHFVVRYQGRLAATPLLVCLVVIETSDVIFAVDSVPAALGVTTDPFLIYTSNIFAILGLRSLYFLLARGLERLEAMHIGLAVVLAFVALKMLLHEIIEIPTWGSLLAIVVILAVTVGYSLVRVRHTSQSAAEDGRGQPPDEHDEGSKP